MYLDLCMHVFMYVYTYFCVCVRIYAVCMCICMYIYVYTHTHTRTHTYTHTHTHTHTLRARTPCAGTSGAATPVLTRACPCATHHRRATAIIRLGRREGRCCRGDTQARAGGYWGGCGSSGGGVGLCAVCGVRDDGRSSREVQLPVVVFLPS